MPARDLHECFDGQLHYLDYFPDDREARIVAPLVVEQLVTIPAIVDTGAPYCIVNSYWTEKLNFDPAEAVSDEQRLAIRGYVVRGYLYRVAFTLEADEGDDLDVDATVFVPQVGPGEPRLSLNFLGLQGFLNRIRFAVDPTTNSFYFGA